MAAAGGAPQLNVGLQQQLNLEDVKNRAMDLFNAITRIRQQLEGNANVKWQDVLSQFSVVNVSLVKIVDDIKKVSKAFVAYPKNVNQENSTSTVEDNEQIDLDEVDLESEWLENNEEPIYDNSEFNITEEVWYDIGAVFRMRKGFDRGASTFRAADL